MKDVHVGRLVNMRLSQMGMSKAEFARRVNRSPQNIQDLIKRESVDTKLLVSICEVLSYNFFKAFIPNNNVDEELTSSTIPFDRITKDKEESLF